MTKIHKILVFLAVFAAYNLFGQENGNSVENNYVSTSAPNKKKFECNFAGCGKAFTWSNSLKRHKQIHKKGEKPYKCDYCDYSSWQSRDLKKHERIHNGEKLYECKFSGCNKAFTRSHDLKEHERIHNGEKPYECTICYSKFSLREGANKHLEDNHNISHDKVNQYITYEKSNTLPNNEIEPKKSRLSLQESDIESDESYSSEEPEEESNDLSYQPEQVHTNSVESNVVSTSAPNKKKLECKIPGCGKAFTTLGSLKVHERIHTGEEPYKCIICDSKFRERGSVKIHLQRAHNIAYDQVNEYITYEKPNRLPNNEIEPKKSRLSLQESEFVSNNVHDKEANTLCNPIVADKETTELTQPDEAVNVNYDTGNNIINENSYSTVKGFTSIDNNSYVNATLQCLSQLNTLNQIILNGTDNDIGCSLIQHTYKNILNDLRDPNIQYIDTRNIVANQMNYFWNYSEHQKVHEFLKYCLNNFDDNCKNLFSIDNVTKVYCNNCGQCTNIQARSNSIILTINEQLEPYNLNDLLNNYFKQKESELHSCDSCYHNNGVEKILLSTLPKILTINIQRFDENGNKIMTPVNFNDSLELKQENVLSPISKHIYNLKGIVYHQDNAYVADVKSSIDNKWYYCNNELINQFDNKIKEPCILFYELEYLEDSQEQTNIFNDTEESNLIIEQLAQNSDDVEMVDVTPKNKTTNKRSRDENEILHESVEEDSSNKRQKTSSEQAANNQQVSEDYEQDFNGGSFSPNSPASMSLEEYYSDKEELPSNYEAISSQPSNYIEPDPITIEQPLESNNNFSNNIIAKNSELLTNSYSTDMNNLVHNTPKSEFIKKMLTKQILIKNCKISLMSTINEIDNQQTSDLFETDNYKEVFSKYFELLLTNIHIADNNQELVIASFKLFLTGSVADLIKSADKKTSK